MLSEFDKAFLNKDQQSQIQGFTKTLETNPQMLNQVHQAVEDIRATAGYSGGVEGGGYEKLDATTIPKATQLAGFGSMPTLGSTAGKVPEINFKSEYSDEIDNMLNEIKNQVDKGFTYDPEKDTSFQSFKNQMRRMGDRAYQSDMAKMSTSTGGVASSWGQSVASQSRNAMLQKTTDAIPQFESLSYEKYRGSISDKMNVLNEYQQKDATDYSRYKDVYETEIKSYLNDIDMAQQQYDNNISQYEMALNEKATSMSDAWSRTQVTGYVSNSDSGILGVPAGTMSESARENKEDMDNFYAKSRRNLSDYKKKINADIAGERSQAIWELENLPQDKIAKEIEEKFDIDAKELKQIDDFTEYFNDEIEKIISKNTTKNSGLTKVDEEKNKTEISAKIDTILDNTMRGYDAAVSSKSIEKQYIALSKLESVAKSTQFETYASTQTKEDMKDVMNFFENFDNEITGTENETENETEVISDPMGTAAERGNSNYQGIK